MSSSFFVYTFGIMLTFSSIAMILLVLIQRGRGGGLAGAFGGQGGQSALGVRAGDVFTKITVVVAVVWVLLAGLLGIAMRAKAANDKAGTTLMQFAEDEPETDVEGEDGAPEVKKADEPTDPAAAGGPLVVPATPDEATTPEATTPEATTPEATTPEATTPEATTPDATSSAEDPKPE